MYKVIPNKKEFLNWKKHLPPEIEKVVQSSDIEELIARQIEALDYYYGTDRAIEADLGGYLLILYGTESDIEKRTSTSAQLPSFKGRRIRMYGYLLEA